MNEIVEAIWKERITIVKHDRRRLETTHQLKMHPRLLMDMKRNLNPFTDYAFHCDLKNCEKFTLFGIEIIEDPLIDSWKLVRK
jgi:hypothetical protein